mmetsp:Transcript_7030/g.11003  ORF Transcript_7030/g.11003 Transcript_7030/m.11003 type:complete len:83 (+) Transcript_7030:621-869(+)
MVECWEIPVSVSNETTRVDRCGCCYITLDFEWDFAIMGLWNNDWFYSRSEPSWLAPLNLFIEFCITESETAEDIEVSACIDK